MLRIYIVGASGFLGRRAAAYFLARGHGVVTDRVDVADSLQLQRTFERTKPDVVINFAGARAYPTIDWCEDHKEETIRVNVTGAINVMLAALAAGAYPMQIASGCIYSGASDQLFTEDSPPNFFGSFYSRMRIVLQDALKELPVLQARIRMPISRFSHPRNLINKIVSYKNVISIPNSLTLLEDLWPSLAILAERSAPGRVTGILNMTNTGYLDHATILEQYKKIVNPSHQYQIISLDELQGTGGITKAQRSNCVLSTEKAVALGVELPCITATRLGSIMADFRQSPESER